MCAGHGESTNQNLKSGTPVIDLNNFDNDSSTSGDRFSQKTHSTPYSILQPQQPQPATSSSEDRATARVSRDQQVMEVVATIMLVIVPIEASTLKQLCRFCQFTFCTIRSQN
ncbi:hypothetical protein HanXRQr2_Chr02g0059601 [Helianthus annuus]|uniref:Uncharacterized protein n=1 Tax=Helianthus annuus TaxID=4232 RepID=A0A251VIA4_HELAN|nr:hypothetical protein HanXRQr2_Chr02g0059601 [Helianthus annuus]KAJ0604372.1 hypothetical protein HanHA300_Chr02g0049051 [Helianthus annuus]KAJ0618404.1 hypothetical protein HanHA89_Chr02g0052881 [Helianthus annuus]KAJ0776851.1 hypothetical protein HanLR1_Chr02g0050431 [Helianthus annuus]